MRCLINFDGIFHRFEFVLNLVNIRHGSQHCIRYLQPALQVVLIFMLVFQPIHNAFVISCFELILEI